MCGIWKKIKPTNIRYSQTFDQIKKYPKLKNNFSKTELGTIFFPVIPFYEGELLFFVHKNCKEIENKQLRMQMNADISYEAGLIH